MAKFRKAKRKNRKCRQCSKPAKINPITGLPMSACPKHLAADRKRAKKSRAA